MDHYQTSTTAGWGWEANRSCVIPAVSPSPVITYPICTALASDPDGDGWDWEANRSCVIPVGMVTTPPTVTPVTAVAPPTGVIVARGGSLYSASGRKLVLRGINLQYGDSPSVRLAGINAIAATGANAVRLELRNATTAATSSSTSPTNGASPTARTPTAPPTVPPSPSCGRPAIPSR